MSDKSRGSAGQKRAAKAKKRAQKNQGTVVSLADRSRRTAVDEYQRLIPIFHAWLLDSGISTGVEMAAAHVVGVGQAVDLLAQDTIRFSATAWRTSDIDHLLEVVPGGEQDRLLIAGEVAVYLLFLGESGLWTGSDADFEDCIETVDEYIDLDDDRQTIWDQHFRRWVRS